MGEQFKWNPSAERMGDMMRQAVYMEDHVTFQHLLKQRANLEAVDESGATPLHIAATHGKTSALAWLLECGADLRVADDQGYDALAWACCKGHQSTVVTLLQSRAAPEGNESSNGKTPLALTAERGHLDCLKELLRARAPLEQTNKEGVTALMSAAHTAETEVVASLLSMQAIVNVADQDGWTALAYAMNAPLATGTGEQMEKKVHIDGVFSKVSMAELLLLHGAKVNVQSADGLSPLVVACAQDRPLAVRKLLEHRAQVNLASARGQTALLMAAANNLPEICRALIVAKADVNHQNEKKVCSLQLADNFPNGDREVFNLLTKAGATAPKGKKGKKKGKKK
jgi:ankyrin repeat protein